MRRLLTILASVITVGVGIVSVYDLTLGTGALAAFFLRIAVVTLAIMIAAGILNLLIVHGGRVARLRRGWPYSFALLVSAGVTFTFWLIGQQQGYRFMLDYIQTPVESALAALLLFALVYGAYRLLQRRFDWSSALFIVTVLIVLVGSLPLAEVGLLAQARDWLHAVPVSAGARGILFGIALAIIVTGVRVLIGQDRSYRE